MGLRGPGLTGNTDRTGSRKKTQETGTADSFHSMNRAAPSPAIAFRKRYSVLPEHSNGLVRSE